MRSRDCERWAIFGLALCLNLAVSWLVVYWMGLFIGDVVARSYSAWQVLLGENPGLTNAGFVWPPLPTLLQVPLIVLPPLRATGFAANVLTSVAGAGTAVALNFLASRLGWSRLARYLLLAAFCLNPMVLFYSANGMSEMMLIFLAVAVAGLYVEWQQSARWVYVAGMALLTALAFLVRYEALLLAIVLGVAILAHSLRDGGRSSSAAEGNLLAYAAPIAYAVGLWIFFNWTIMGNPLYFANSPYSNAGQISYQLTLRSWLLPLKGDPAGAVRLVLNQVWALFPPFVLSSALVALVAAWKRTWLCLGLLALAWCFPAFQAASLVLGQSAFWLRYLILAIPMGFVMVIWLVRYLPTGRKWAEGIAAVALAAAALSSGDAMVQAPEHGQQWNDIFIQSLLTRQPPTDEWATWATDRTMANYVDEQGSAGLVLVDAFQGHSVAFFSRYPGRFLTNSDHRYKAALKEPYGRVSYVLVSRPEQAGALNEVNITFPGLYAGGADWARLEKESGGWRLYRVVGPRTTAATSNR